MEQPINPDFGKVFEKLLSMNGQFDLKSVLAHLKGGEEPEPSKKTAKPTSNLRWHQLDCKKAKEWLDWHDCAGVCEHALYYPEDWTIAPGCNTEECSRCCEDERKKERKQANACQGGFPIYPFQPPEPPTPGIPDDSDTLFGEECREDWCERVYGNRQCIVHQPGQNSCCNEFGRPDPNRPKNPPCENAPEDPPFPEGCGEYVDQECCEEDTEATAVAQWLSQLFCYSKEREHYLDCAICFACVQGLYADCTDQYSSPCKKGTYGWPTPLYVDKDTAWQVYRKCLQDMGEWTSTSETQTQQVQEDESPTQD